MFPEGVPLRESHVGVPRRRSREGGAVERFPCMRSYRGGPEKGCTGGCPLEGVPLNPVQRDPWMPSGEYVP